MIVRMQSGRAGLARDTAAAWACLVFVLTAAYLVPIAPRGLNVYDEGIRLYGAQRVLEGQMPYRDFFAYYAPAQFYWPAVLLELFGQRILAVRLGSLLFVALGAVAVFALGRRAGLGAISASAPVVGLVLPLTSGARFLLCDPSFTSSLAAGALLTGVRGEARGRRLAAGALLGVALLFRQDFGAAGVFAAFGTIAWSEYRRAPERGSPLSPLLRTAKGWGLLVAAATLVALPLYLLVALPDPRALFDSLVLLPSRILPYRTLPYPYTLGAALTVLSGVTVSADTPDQLSAVLILVSPLLLLGAAVILLAPRPRRRVLADADRRRVLVFLALTALGVAPYAVGRSDEYHMYPLYVVAVGIGAVVAVTARPAMRRSAGLRTTAVAALGFLLGVTLGTAVGALSASEPLGVAGASRVMVGADTRWVAAAVRDLQATDDGRPILVASPRHDRVHTIALVVYVLAHRPSATYFHDFIPGVTTSRAVQERIVADLRRHDVRTVLIAKVWLPEEPNRSRESSGITVLDDYLRAEYAPVKQTPDYGVLRRRARSPQ